MDTDLPQPPPVADKASLRQRLVDATSCKDIDRLHAVIVEAHRDGVTSPDVRRAREMLVSMEVQDLHQSVDDLVGEAIRSNDHWKLQAAMQTVVGAGLGSEAVARLKEAMREHKQRQEALRELRRAAERRDAPSLRVAIEAALKIHVADNDVGRFRAALQALEARATAKRKLRAVATSVDLKDLQEAVHAAKAAGLHEEPKPPLGKDPEEMKALRTVQEQLRSVGLLRLQSSCEAQDVGRLTQAVEEAADCGLDETDVADYVVQLSKMRAHAVLRQELRAAVELGDKVRLREIVSAAEAAGLTVADRRSAQEALDVHLAEEERASLRARTLQELQDATVSEDVERLASALAACDAAEIGRAEVAPARERLRQLRLREGAVQELRAAAAADNRYRLRAALAVAASTHEVGEADLQQARDALQALDQQVEARRSLDTAVASQDFEFLQRAIALARRAGVKRIELESAEAQMRQLGQSEGSRELRAAMVSDDPERLRAATNAAVSAGMMGTEIDAAWQRLRELEAGQWQRRQLRAAAASGDVVRLQASLKQAELAGFSGEELNVARAALQCLNAQVHARQELQLARASRNPDALRAALLAAQEAGLKEEELEGTAADLGGYFRCTTAPQEAHTTVKDSNDGGKVQDKPLGLAEKLGAALAAATPLRGSTRVESARRRERTPHPQMTSRSRLSNSLPSPRASRNGVGPSTAADAPPDAPPDRRRVHFAE